MHDRHGHDCPICGVIDDRLPDAYGVHTCRRCHIEFRPPQRLPVRGAVISKVDDMSLGSDKVPWGLVVAGAVVVGAIISVIKGPDHSPLSYSPPPSFELPELQPVPMLDPAVFDAIGPTTVTLGLELHAELLVRDSEIARRVHLTGLVRNPEPSRLDRVQVDVHMLDAEHQRLVTQQAVVACPQLPAHESCAWALDASIADPVVSWRIEATGTRELVGPFPLIEVRGRFDAEGQPLADDGDLSLDVDKQMVTFTNARPINLLEAWASVTALDEHGQVVDVTLTRLQDAGRSTGDITRPIALPKFDAASYDVRVVGLGGY